MSKMEEKIEGIIRKYLSLQDKVEVLAASSRLAAKEDAARLSIAAGELHTRLQDIIEEHLFLFKTDNLNRIQNRSEIAKILGFCRELGIPNISDYNNTLYFSFPHDFDIELLMGEENNLILQMEYKEVVSIDFAVSGQYFKPAYLDVPSIEMASSELKEFAKKFGYKLKSYVTGSFHEQFGIVCVDFESKES